MQKPDTIDFAKLLGFDTVTRDPPETSTFKTRRSAQKKKKIGNGQYLLKVAERHPKGNWQGRALGLGSGDNLVLAGGRFEPAWVGGTNASPHWPEEPSLPYATL